jgi:hypothetical protein
MSPPIGVRRALINLPGESVEISGCDFEGTFRAWRDRPEHLIHHKRIKRKARRSFLRS